MGTIGIPMNLGIKELQAILLTNQSSWTVLSDHISPDLYFLVYMHTVLFR